MTMFGCGCHLPRVTKGSQGCPANTFTLLLQSFDGRMNGHVGTSIPQGRKHGSASHAFENFTGLGVNLENKTVC